MAITELGGGGGGVTIVRDSITNADSPHAVALNTELFVDASGGAITVNFPAASTWTAGDTITVIVTDATTTTTLDGSASETISGATTQPLTTTCAVTIRCNGTALFIS